MQWLQFFVEQVRPTPDKVLLVWDNHESHKIIKAVDYAKENNVLFLSFAPHMMHKIQSLDIAVCGPMKTFLKKKIAHSKETMLEQLFSMILGNYLPLLT